MNDQWNRIIGKWALIFCALNIFAVADVHASPAEEMAAVCVDSDYTDLTDYKTIRAHKMHPGANMIGTSIACVEKRSKSFIVKSELFDDIANRKLGIKATRFALCNFDKVFRFGLGALENPYEVLHQENEATNIAAWVRGQIRDRVRDDVEAAMTPAHERLDDQCDNYGFNEGLQGTPVKQAMQNAVNLKTGEAVSELFCGDQSNTRMRTPEQWSAYLEARCRSNPGEAVDLNQWIELQRTVRNARDGKVVPSRRDIEAFAPKDNCPMVQMDTGRIFNARSDAEQQCSQYGILKINGREAYHCPSKKLQGPKCGVYYAVSSTAIDNCSQYGIDRLPSGAARFYCPPKTAQAEAPEEGMYFALIAEAWKNCSQYGVKRLPNGAAQYHCPPKTSLAPENGTYFAFIADASKNCSQYGIDLLPSGAARYYCPPKKEKAGANGMWYAVSSDAARACTQFGAEKISHGSVRYFCPEPVQGIYRANKGALSACRDIGSEPDRAGSRRFYCRDR